MSITRIMNNGVLGLTAQSHALGTISHNIANARTVGYKGSQTEFSDFVVQDRHSTRFEGAGVRASDRLLADRQGQVTQTGVKTNAAIVGNGFFLVQEIDRRTGEVVAPNTTKGAAAGASTPQLTRAGDFQADQFGHFVNSSGRALMGFPLSPGQTLTAANYAVANLELVSLDGIAQHYEPSTRLDVTANLPAEQAVTETPTTVDTLGMPARIVDAEGNVGTMTLRFMKTAEGEDGSQTWRIYNAGVTYPNGTAVDGPKPSDPTSWAAAGTFTIGADGTLAGGAAGAQATVTLTPGGQFQPLTLGLGRYGSTVDSVTAMKGLPFNGLSADTNGIPAGSFLDVELTHDGYVRASYGNGEQRDFYRIPTGVVANAAGLKSVSGTAFLVSEESGGVELKDFGKVNPGSRTADDPTKPTTVGTTLAAAAVEESNVKIEEQFTTLIQAQRTYSAASKLVSTADEMTQIAFGMKA